MSASTNPEETTTKPISPETTTKTAPNQQSPSRPKQTFQDVAMTLQFAWFAGQLVTLVSSILCALGLFGIKSFLAWHVIASLAICETFGILLFQTFRNTSFSARQVLADDNSQYLLLGLALLWFRPYSVIVLAPSAIFSLFHVLGYTKSVLLPLFGLESHPILIKIGTFVANNHAKLVQLACMIEVYAYVWLTLRMITLRPHSFYMWLAYSVFLKLRFDKLTYTRNYINTLEVQIDGIVGQYSQDVPALKTVWINIKSGLRAFGSISVEDKKHK